MKIFIIEDDFTLAEEICRLCIKWNFEAEYLEDFSAIEKAFEMRKPDLLLMDINIPSYDGFYWCRRIREVSRVPILFLSSRDQNSDKMLAMLSGGDDYVEKPFDSELLLVKIRSLLRRAYEYTQNDREYIGRDLIYDRGQGVLIYKDRVIELTKSESRIMSMLAEGRGRVVEREVLMQQLWNTDEYVTDASLTVLVSRLKSKIAKAADGLECIRTKKGKGYYLE